MGIGVWNPRTLVLLCILSFTHSPPFRVIQHPILSRPSAASPALSIDFCAAASARKAAAAAASPAVSAATPMTPAAPVAGSRGRGRPPSRDKPILLGIKKKDVTVSLERIDPLAASDGEEAHSAPGTAAKADKGKSPTSSLHASSHFGSRGLSFTGPLAPLPFCPKIIPILPK